MTATNTNLTGEPETDAPDRLDPSLMWLAVAAVAVASIVAVFVPDLVVRISGETDARGIERANGIGLMIGAVLPLVVALLFSRAWGPALPYAVGRKQITAHSIIALAAIVVYGVVSWAASLGLSHDVLTSYRTEPNGFSILYQVVQALAIAMAWFSFVAPMLERFTTHIKASMLVAVLMSLGLVAQFIQSSVNAGVAASAKIFVPLIILSLLLSFFVSFIANGSGLQRLFVGGAMLIAFSFLQTALVSGLRLDPGVTWAHVIGAAVMVVLFMAVFFAAQAKRARARDEGVAPVGDEDATLQLDTRDGLLEPTHADPAVVTAAAPTAAKEARK